MAALPLVSEATLAVLVSRRAADVCELFSPSHIHSLTSGIPGNYPDLGMKDVDSPPRSLGRPIRYQVGGESCSDISSSWLTTMRTTNKLIG